MKMCNSTASDCREVIITTLRILAKISLLHSNVHAIYDIMCTLRLATLVM
jgi:hypothetical protein